MVQEKFKYNQASVDAGGENCPHCLINFYLKNNSKKIKIKIILSCFINLIGIEGGNQKLFPIENQSKKVFIKQYKSYYNLIQKISVLKKLS